MHNLPDRAEAVEVGMRKIEYRIERCIVVVSHMASIGAADKLVKVVMERLNALVRRFSRTLVAECWPSAILVIKKKCLDPSLQACGVRR